MLETEGLISKISDSVSSNAVGLEAREDNSSLDGELKTQRQDHNFSVTVLQKLCRIKIFRQTRKSNEWNVYCFPCSCPLSDFSLFAA